MINRRHFLTTVAVGTASAAALAACGNEAGTSAGETGSAESPVTINYTWWGNDDRAARYDQHDGADHDEPDDPGGQREAGGAAYDEGHGRAARLDPAQRGRRGRMTHHRPDDHTGGLTHG